MRIIEVELHSPDPVAQMSFYCERLGLPSEGDAIKAGGTRIRFVAGDSHAYHLAFNIPENQIEPGTEWISTRARMLSDEIFDFDFWHAHAAYFEDPDGNILELIARHSIDNASTAPFGPASLLEVSEVGLASDAPGDLARRLEGEVGLPVYSGDRESFTAIGDERGLFIVVGTGRHWLPTEVSAAPVALRVTVAGPTAGQFDLSPDPVVIARVP